MSQDSYNNLCNQKELQIIEAFKELRDLQKKLNNQDSVLIKKARTELIDQLSCYALYFDWNNCARFNFCNNFCNHDY